MWISFLIPKIEDGNNFGVSIQEDTLAEIRTVESEAAAFFDQISRYFITRGKIVTKVGIMRFQVWYEVVTQCKKFVR
jgi:proteasome activator subunit 3 (PA28 gamma)